MPRRSRAARSASARSASTRTSRHRSSAAVSLCPPGAAGCGLSPAAWVSALPPRASRASAARAEPERFENSAARASSSSVASRPIQNRCASCSPISSRKLASSRSARRYGKPRMRAAIASPTLSRATAASACSKSAIQRAAALSARGRGCGVAHAVSAQTSATVSRIDGRRTIGERRARDAASAHRRTAKRTRSGLGHRAAPGKAHERLGRAASAGVESAAREFFSGRGLGNSSRGIGRERPGRGSTCCSRRRAVPLLRDPSSGADRRVGPPRCLFGSSRQRLSEGPVQVARTGLSRARDREYSEAHRFTLKQFDEMCPVRRYDEGCSPRARRGCEAGWGGGAAMVRSSTRSDHGCGAVAGPGPLEGRGVAWVARATRRAGRGSGGSGR